MDSPFASLDSYIMRPDQKLQAQAFADALRGGAGPAQQGPMIGNAAPQMQQQGVVGANPNMGSMITPDMMSGLGSALRGGANNLYTAGQYGTNPFSQQTNMLAAQEAGMGW